MPVRLDASGSPVTSVTVLGVRGIGEVVAGADVASLVVDALAHDRELAELQEGSLL